MRFNPSTGPGAAPMRRPFTACEVAALRAEVLAQHEEPVHVLREGGEQLAALPVPERVERRVRGARHEVEPPVAQFLVGPGDGKQQLDRRVEALLLEETQLDRGDRREVRWRDEVGNGDAEHVCHVC